MTLPVQVAISLEILLPDPFNPGYLGQQCTQILNTNYRAGLISADYPLDISTSSVKSLANMLCQFISFFF